jgi:hypothetical protein
MYDWEGLYKMVWQWMGRHRYRVHETRYREKASSPLGNDIKMRFDGEKEVNEYVKYWMHVYFRVYDLKEFEVVEDGVKKKMTNGRLWIRLWGEYELDYSNRFKGGKFIELLGKGYNKVQERMIELKYEDDFHYHLYDLHAAIRSFLRMQHAAVMTPISLDGRTATIDARLEKSPV